jgi:cellulose synthase/poly-beta-1,6-N-acetylglucosamine synthase-like glycosyltransferase
LSIAYIISNFRFLLRIKGSAPPLSKRWPSVAVIAPHKGVEPEIRNNLISLLSQDYPSAWEIIFVTEFDKDDAYGVIKELIASMPYVRARLITVGKGVGRSSQKIRNLLRAFREVSQDTEVVAFIDSDARVSPQWLRSLVAPLDQSGVGAATGYRLFSIKKGFWEAICVLWDSVHLLAFNRPRTSFTWGGSMAIRSELFRELEVAKIWQECLSDDLSLTYLVRKKGLRIAFAPSACGISTPPSSSRSEFYGWATRQMVMARLYMRRLWMANLSVLIIYHMMLIGDVIEDVFIRGYRRWLLSTALVILLLSRLLGASLRQRAVKILSGGKIRWPVSILLLDFLIPTMSFFLWFSSWRIKVLEWRGTLYRLRDYKPITQAK